MSFNIGDRVRFKEDDLGKWQIFEGTEATVTKVGHPDAPVRVLGMRVSKTLQCISTICGQMQAQGCQRSRRKYWRRYKSTPHRLSRFLIHK